ncbi:ANTAR domain-containing response regulator [Candidatus Vondammii sp. HM_W22]|uniref:ANTAR domain-containing response regulator n=1 Tax=Candidatus Vondammii sp. HM_W22 TaxID=2687299 RepID=UPI001F13300A|nr:ANTAR domain-containing protein [Candidatus Vondammii sp. HM_W22]
MPGTFGIEAARQLREKAGVQSIFLTAFCEKEVVELAVKEGALGYLVKPVVASQLIPTIETALERAAERDKLHNNETNLMDALNRNRDISVAVGIFMERFNVSKQQASEALRSYSRTTRCKLIDVARNLVEITEGKNDLINQIHKSSSGKKH